MVVEEELSLREVALKLRIYVINSIFLAKSGHPGSSLSCLDILLYLYKKVLKVDCNNAHAKDRDRFVLSKGHAAPALYAVLAEAGFLKFEDLKSLRKFGSFLQGHPNMNSTKGVEMSTGSLGQGISAACGMAAGLKLNNSSARVYCLLGDGELQEGQVFEAFCFAFHNKLSNLTFIVDNNGLQIDGPIEEVAGFKNLEEKFKAFGLEVLNVDGHNFFELEKVFEKAKMIKDKPTIIIAKTVKGKGVSFMENKANWHGKAPNEEEHKIAINELEQEIKKIKG